MKHHKKHLLSIDFIEVFDLFILVILSGLSVLRGIDVKETFVETNKINNTKNLFESENNIIKKSNIRHSKTIEEFNEENLCKDLIANYYELEPSTNEQTRYNRIGGDSKAFIVYNNTNTFKDFTGKIDGFKPFDLYKYLYHENDFKKALKEITNEDSFLSTEEYNEIVNNSLDSPFFHFLQQIGHYKNDEERKQAVTNLRYCAKDDNLTPFDKERIFKKFVTSESFKYDVSSFISNDLQTSKIQLNDNALKEEDRFIDPDWIINTVTKRVSVLIAGCGVGKTFSFIQHDRAILKQKKTLYVLPRTILIHQQAKAFNGDFKIFACSGGNCTPKSKNITFFNNISENIIELFDINKLSAECVDAIKKPNSEIKPFKKELKEALKSGVLTYDQFVNLKNHYVSLYDIVALDESHTLSLDSGFRFEQIEKCFKKVEILASQQGETKFIFVTATAGIETSVFHSVFKENMQFLYVDKVYETYPEVNMINVERKRSDGIIFKQIINSVLAKRKVIIFINSKKMIQGKWDNFNRFCKKNNFETPKIAFVTSTDKSLDVYDEIVNNESLGDTQVLFCTSFMEAGVNIKIDEGIDFIFDYSQNRSHTNAKGALQLIYRNRNRDSKVYVFIKAFDNKGKSKLSKKNQSYQSVDSFMSSKYFKAEFDKYSSKESNSVSVEQTINTKIRNRTALLNGFLTKKLSETEKNFSTFLLLANQHNCVIKFEFENYSNSIETSRHNSNEIVVKIIREILNVNENIDIKIIPIIDDKFSSYNVHDSFSVISKEFKDDKLLINASYHSSYNFIINEMSYYINYLRRFYFPILKDIFNFVIHQKVKNEFINSIKDYIETHKLLFVSKNLLGQKFIKESYNFNINDAYEMNKKVEEFIIENYEKCKFNASQNKVRLTSEQQKLLTTEYLDFYLKEELQEYIDSILSKIFSYHNEKKGSYYKTKYVVSNFKEEKKQEGDDILFMTLNPRSVNTSLLGSILEINDTNQYRIDSSNKNILERISEGYFKNTSYEVEVQKDYFNTTDYFDKEMFSNTYFDEHHISELEAFREAHMSKRSNQCFVMVNLKDGSIAIQQTKEKIFKLFETKKILATLLSNDNKDFTKKTIFDKHIKLCRNYYLVKYEFS